MLNVYNSNLDKLLIRFYLYCCKEHSRPLGCAKSSQLVFFSINNDLFVATSNRLTIYIVVCNYNYHCLNYNYHCLNYNYDCLIRLTLCLIPQVKEYFSAPSRT